jgi:hypothetical protein
MVYEFILSLPSKAVPYPGCVPVGVNAALYCGDTLDSTASTLATWGTFPRLVAVIVGFGIRVTQNTPFGNATSLWIDLPGFGYHRGQGNPLSLVGQAIHGLPNQFHSA